MLNATGARELNRFIQISLDPQREMRVVDEISLGLARMLAGNF